MTIVDAQDRKRNREFTILRRDSQPEADRPEDATEAEKKQARREADRSFTGEQKFYVYFHRPADVNKMVFLVHKHLKKDDDRWLYLPALDLVKRIAATDKRTSFVGSHFFYEDVSGRNVDLDKHELVETSENYYVLKNTPKDPDNVEFAYYKMWIHRDSFVVVQISYYDKRGKEYRRYNALRVEDVQGFPTVMKSRMTDLTDKSYTTLEYSDVKYNVGLDEDVFTERRLRRPPLKVLK
jgi:outer membrane lipoprotein-sorting protein